MRYDLDLVASWIAPGSKVLDLGCGQGELLQHLHDTKGVQGFGVEQDEEKAATGISRGVSILQGDMAGEVRDYPDNAFDVVVLSQTLQQVAEPLGLIRQMLRVGKRAVVSFPNFAHWRNRCQLFFQGNAPVTPELPYDWHDTPNIRVITFRDFHRFCNRFGFTILEAVAVKTDPASRGGLVLRLLPNLRATYGIFLLARS
ncbi:methionine biosynthesis protein MetW [Fundidesulfovibrio magnetotacticus]|uniref:methionine biosynthesis protein MetW n=1 Tax=Fundidesulfovibrio magnetotacticus TaxID=2730080 RepID=UPI00156520CC|nr:methionine biosynthesis protein MetW [Fundidesulfovibrio magnetotacticus]